MKILPQSSGLKEISQLVKPLINLGCNSEKITPLTAKNFWLMRKSTAMNMEAIL
jgi:hypothetical protein